MFDADEVLPGHIKIRSYRMSVANRDTHATNQHISVARGHIDSIECLLIWFPVALIR